MNKLHLGEQDHSCVATQWISKPTIKQHMRFIDTTFRIQSGIPRQVSIDRERQVIKGAKRGNTATGGGEGEVRSRVWGDGGREVRVEGGRNVACNIL